MCSSLANKKRYGQPCGRPVSRGWGRDTNGLLSPAKTASRLARVEHEWCGVQSRRSDGGRVRACSEPGTRPPPSACESCAATPWPPRTRLGSQTSRSNRPGRGLLCFLYCRLAVHQSVECGEGAFGGRHRFWIFDRPPQKWCSGTAGRARYRLEPAVGLNEALCRLFNYWVE